MTVAALRRPAGARNWRGGLPARALPVGLVVVLGSLLGLAFPVSGKEKPGPPAGIFGRIARVGRPAGSLPAGGGADTAGAPWRGLFPSGEFVVKGGLPSLRVSRRGQAPGRLLRCLFRPDPRGLVVSFQGSMSVEAGGFRWPEFPLPGVRAVFRLTPADHFRPGGYQGRWHLSEAGLAPGVPASPLLAGPVERALQSPRVRGAHGRATWGGDGLLTLLSVSRPGAGGGPALETKLVDGVLAGFPPLWPSVPVGVGASWESVQDLQVDGRSMRTTLGYRVVGLQHDSVRLSVSLRGSAGRGAKGPGGAPSGAAVDASGALLWNLQSPFPSDGSLRGQASFPLAWSSGGTVIRGEAVLKFAICLGSD